jgi:acetylornithine deacetylase/succinyl-diaminopimelate desuccinylase-like protein
MQGGAVTASPAAGGLCYERFMAVDWDRAGAEAVALLKDLVRIDTTNPPGNERPAVDYVAGVLAREGIDFQVVESEPTRASVVARLRGSGAKPPLLLSAHLDVVPADREHWTRDPFGAEEADGCVWGRGTLDMKNMAAMSLAVLLWLRREQVPLDRDVIFAAIADEEAGSRHGSLFLVERHPDLVRAPFVLTEVGGYSTRVGATRFYPIQVSEKGMCWFEIVAQGEPGHGSMPHPHNAVVRLARAIRDLGNTRLPLHVTPVVERFVRRLAEAAGFPARHLLPLLLNPALSPAILALFQRFDLAQAIGLNAMLRNTVSPTMLEAGRKVNVIPARAAARLDGRIVPGQTLEDFLAEVRRVVGADLEIRVIEHHEGCVFDSETELFEVLSGALREHDREAVPVPFMVPGFTDAFAYAKLGAVCYGFVPLQLPPDLPFTRLFHGHDERVPIDGYRWGLRVLYDVVARFCGRT